MRAKMLIVLLLAAACSEQRQPPAAAMNEARKIWVERCANCHGERGHGNGPGAKILAVEPRALSDSGWQHSVTDEHIEKVILEGGQAVGRSPSMAANPDLRTKPEVLEALVQVVRDLAG